MEINLNSFVNILIKEFYNTYITEYNDYYDNILHELNTFAINNKDELAELIINKFIFIPIPFALLKAQNVMKMFP